MKTETNARTLSDALAVLKRYAGTNGPTKAAAYVEITSEEDAGTITLRRWAWKTGTDVTARFAARNVDGETTRAYVDADALATAVKGRKGTATLTVDGDRLTIAMDDGNASIPLRDGANYPDRAAFHWMDAGTVMNDEADALRSVVAVANRKDNWRAVLGAVRFDSDAGTATATDTYRMHVARLRGLKRSALIPADALAIALATIGNGGILSFGVSPEDEGFFTLAYNVTKGTSKLPRFVAYSITGRTVKGPFPSTDTIVATAQERTSTVWTIRDAAGTADVLASFANTRNIPSILTAAGSAVRVSATEDGTTRDALAPIVTDGDTIGGDPSIAFNARYFADAVKLAGDGAPIALSDGLRPAIFGSTDADAYALLMPMRTS